MAIYNRCPECRTLNVLKNLTCSKCLSSMKGVKSYYVRLMVDGKSISKLAGKTITEAKMIEAKIKSCKGGQYLENKEKIDFGFFISNIFMPHYEGKNKETRRAFGKLKFIAHSFQNKYLSEISAYDIEKFFQHQLKINAISTANNYLAYIKRIFNYAIEMDYIKTSPVKTKIIYTDNKRIRYLKENEEEKLLCACKKSKNSNLYAITLIALDTGMRRGEIAAIKEDDIYNNIITVRGESAKSKKSRHIPLTKNLQLILKDIHKLKLDGDIKNSFSNALKVAGIEDFRFHDLRHTFASKLVMKGVDLYTVSKLLGHASIEMTQRYAHLAPSAFKNAIEKLEANE